MGNKEVFMLRRRGLPDKSVPWDIVIEDPLTAIEVVRRGWGPHDVDVARELFSRGLAFRTVLRIPTAPSLSQHGVQYRWALGLFAAGYTPTVYDYTVYEDARKDLFQQRGPLRAALRMGGIVWRLAMESLGFDDILAGPSLEAANPWIMPLGDEYGVDDVLSDADLDLICGVYRVRTGTYFASSLVTFRYSYSCRSRAERCVIELVVASPRGVDQDNLQPRSMDVARRVVVPFAPRQHSCWEGKHPGLRSLAQFVEGGYSMGTDSRQSHHGCARVHRAVVRKGVGRRRRLWLFHFGHSTLAFVYTLYY